MNISQQKSQDLGFSQQQKEELREMFSLHTKEMTEIVDSSISHAFDDFISNVFQPYLADQARRWEKSDQRFLIIEQKQDAHTLNFYSVQQKLDAFVDISSQHGDRLLQLEKTVYS